MGACFGGLGGFDLLQKLATCSLVPRGLGLKTSSTHVRSAQDAFYRISCGKIHDPMILAGHDLPACLSNSHVRADHPSMPASARRIHPRPLKPTRIRTPSQLITVTVTSLPIDAVKGSPVSLLNADISLAISPLPSITTSIILLGNPKM